MENSLKYCYYYIIFSFYIQEIFQIFCRNRPKNKNPPHMCYTADFLYYGKLCKTDLAVLHCLNTGKTAIGEQTDITIGADMLRNPLLSDNLPLFYVLSYRRSDFA